MAAEGPVVAHVSYDGSVPWVEVVESSLDHVPPDAQISHLLLVVHGVGHPNGDASGNIGLDSLINTFQDSLALAHANSAEPVPGRVLVLGVEWYSVINGTFHSELSPPTNPELRVVREILRDTLGSVMAFLGPKYKQILVSETLTQLDGLHALVRSKFHNFSGDSSVVGHSLGGDILYEIMTTSPPSFTPANLFYLGTNVSPYSLLSQDGPEKLKRHVLASLHTESRPRIYNIYHPHHILAYRIEPSIDARWGDIPPCRIPQVEGDFVRACESLARSAASFFMGTEGDLLESPQEHEQVQDFFVQSRCSEEDEEKMVVSPDDQRVGLLDALVRTFTPTSGDEQEEQNHDQESGELSEVLHTLAGADTYGTRIDFELPCDDSASSVLPLMLRQGQAAHSSYWSNPDLAHYILRIVCTEQLSLP